MEFKHLQAFVAVTELKSFTKAAQRLYLTQPTISSQIHQLEEELGVVLLMRTTKSLQITPEGQRLYEYAKGIMNLQDKIFQRCTGDKQNIIHIGASTIPAIYILPGYIAAYQQSGNTTRYEIYKGDSQDTINALLEGRIDIGFTGMKGRNTSLNYTPFCRDKMVLITPVTEYFQSMKEQGEKVIPKLLKSPVIYREEGSGSRQGALRFLEKSRVKEKDLDISVRTDNTEMIKHLVMEGMGVSIISDLAIKEELKSGRLLSFSYDSEPCFREFYLITRKDYPLPDYVRDFMEFFTKNTGKQLVNM